MNGTEALCRAVCQDDVVSFRKVLASEPQLKTRINEAIGPFDSPLVMSVKSRAMLDALLEAGADINGRSKWWAGSFGLLDMANDDLAHYAMEKGARLDVHSAARLGLIDKLRPMLDANPALVHARGGDGKTPLHFARNVEIARLLVERGADIDARDIDHESTPAQYLIGEHQDVARFLVQRGCKTDIFLAAALGDTNLASRWIDADPNCVRMRVNAQHFPMRNPHAGGTIYQWTLGFNISPHGVALKFGRNETFAFFMERSPAEVQLLVQCWLGNNAEVSKILRDSSVLERLTPAEKNQLADAARNNNAAAVKLMVRAGLPADARGQHNGTALHWAAWHGNVELVRLLLERGAALEDTDNDFRATPLGWAMHGSENGWERGKGDYVGTVRALLAAGAKVPARTDGTPEVRAALSK